MARMTTRRRRKAATRGKRTKTTRAGRRKVGRAKARKPRRAKAPTADRVRAALRADRTMTREERRRVEAVLPAIRRILG